jgi:hypothetical protein
VRAQRGLTCTLAATAALVTAGTVGGQTCGEQWIGITPARTAGVTGSSGPGTVSAVIDLGGGRFAIGGSWTARGSLTHPVAQWDGQNWQSLGEVAPFQSTSSISHMIQARDGSLYAVGTLHRADSPPGANQPLARLRNNRWEFMPGALTLGTSAATASRVVELPNGDVVIAGRFTRVGSVTVNGIARWNGSEWLPFGSGLGTVVANTVSFGNTQVFALAAMPNGEVIVGGQFTVAGGQPVWNIARWDGTRWWAFDEGLGEDAGQGVRGLACTPDGTLYATGLNTPVRRRDPDMWRPATPNSPFGLNSFVGTGVGVSADGRVFTSRMLTGSSSEVRILAGSSVQRVRVTIDVQTGFMFPAVVGADGSIILGGRFATVEGRPANSLAKWDGQRWNAIAGGLSGGITDLVVWRGGLAVAGDFTEAPNTLARRLAFWDGRRWQGLGSGTNMAPRTLLALPSGDLLAVGGFTTAGGSPAPGVARWDGLRWTAMGAGSIAFANSAVVDSAGRLFVSTSDSVNGQLVGAVRQWTGTDWASFATGFRLADGTGGQTDALLPLPDGRLVVGGLFNDPAPFVAVVDGSSSRGLGEGTTGAVKRLLAGPAGSFFAAGSFTRAGPLGNGGTQGLALWNGSEWQSVGGGLRGIPADAALTADGQLLVAGVMPSVLPDAAPRAARWNGSAWRALPPVSTGRADNVVALPNGEIVLAGSFTLPGDPMSWSLIRLSPTGAPTLALEPTAQSVGPGLSAVLRAAPAAGYANVRVRWLRNGQPIQDGPGGAAPGGGVVVGAQGSLASPTAEGESTLTIMEASCRDAGDYAAEFFNDCGAVRTVSVRLDMGPCVVCPANYNGDAWLNLDDLGDFISDFFIDPAIPGGAQPAAPSFAGVSLGFGRPCPEAPDAPAPYAPDAYRLAGYRVGFSPDGTNHCPQAQEQPFPNLDALADFITAFYRAEGC